MILILCHNISTDFLLGFEVTEVILHENETLELGIAVLAGAGTEIPFSVTYFTASGTAQGIQISTIILYLIASKFFSLGANYVFIFSSLFHTQF